MSKIIPLIDAETERLIRYYYVNEKMGLEDTARKFGHTSCWLTPRLKALSIPCRSYIAAHKQFEFDESYFEKIDSHEKALIFGFIIADGCVHQSLTRPSVSPRLQISLQARDIEYLEYIKKCLKFTGPVRTHRANNDRDYCHIVITSKKICEDLMKLGCQPRKSLVCLFPTVEQVPEEFLSSFICGFFDGDGGYCLSRGVHVRNLSAGFAISYDMALFLQPFLKDRLNINTYLNKELRDANKDPRTHIWKLTTGGNQQSLRLAEWMYSKAPFKMERKYQQFLSIRQHYDENLNFIVPQAMKDNLRRVAIETHKGKKRSLECRLKLSQSKNSAANRALWTTISVKSPNGNLYYSNCSNRFFHDELEKYQLHYTHLRRLTKGECAAYKGWVNATPQEIEESRKNGTLIEKLY